MIRSFYTVNRSMNVLKTEQENISANIANVTTPGYKFQEIVKIALEELPLANFTGRKDSRRELGTFVFGNRIDEAYRNFQQGVLKQTEQATDFAIVGEGFFTIDLGNQYGFTRNGNFMVNTEGQLITQDGNPVMGIINGQITPIFVNDYDFNVDDNGNISGQDVSFLLVEFENVQNLEEIGNNIFIGDGFNISQSQVKQGYLEMSNVEIADQLVKMIQTSREFEANQKALQTADETLSKAVNEIGRV